MKNKKILLNIFTCLSFFGAYSQDGFSVERKPVCDPPCQTDQKPFRRSLYLVGNACPGEVQILADLTVVGRQTLCLLVEQNRAAQLVVLEVGVGQIVEDYIADKPRFENLLVLFDCCRVVALGVVLVASLKDAGHVLGLCLCGNNQQHDQQHPETKSI